jgi:hypothetical protein
MAMPTQSPSAIEPEFHAAERKQDKEKTLSRALSSVGATSSSD